MDEELSSDRIEEERCSSERYYTADCFLDVLETLYIINYGSPLDFDFANKLVLYAAYYK